MLTTTNRNSHIIAITGVLLVHLGAISCMMKPSEQPRVLPQAIKVTMVAPSTSNSENFKASSKTEATNHKEPELDDKGPKEKVSKSEEKKKKNTKADSTPSTTVGQQSDQAIENSSAITDPVYDAVYLQNPAPTYPQSARKAGVQGTVTLEVTVTTEGRAKSILIANSSGSSVLDIAAKNAVAVWKFVPAKKGVESVEARVLVPVEFKLS